jgi:hypothetical protein
MKTTILYCFASLLVGTLESCEKADIHTSEAEAALGACATTSKTVRAVTQRKGFVSLDQSTQQYRIFAHQPGTIDVVDVGVVCGSLPASLQVEGYKVVFSGTYKEYKNAPSAPVGYTYYYLELSKIEVE